MRHYPRMPKTPESDNLLAKASCKNTDEDTINGMAVLVQQLGFDSPEIKHIIKQSPDRQIAVAALLKAWKPDCYRYDSDVFESLINCIVEYFLEAVPNEPQSSCKQLVGGITK